MRERLANRHKTPTEEKIRAFTGEEAFDRMALITGTLSALFRIKRKLLFLRGGDSCWGYRITYQSNGLLRYFIFEKGGMMAALPGEKTEPCGEPDAGERRKDATGWVRHNLESPEHLRDLAISLGRRTGKDIRFTEA